METIIVTDKLLRRYPQKPMDDYIRDVLKQDTNKLIACRRDWALRGYRLLFDDRKEAG